MLVLRRAHHTQSQPGYERHRPEQTLLYRLIQQHYPQLLTTLAERGLSCPPRGTGAQAKSESHPLPWRVRAQQ
jgi:hypothetical protein